jgi:trimeric autotransporter adhesin
MHRFRKLLIWAGLASSFALNVFAQGTAFNYQGQLNDGTNPANGSYDLTFAIYGGLTGGSPVAGPATNSAIGITNGLFSVTLDFGSSPFSAGAQRWVEIAARTNGATSFTTLAPRQKYLATPYAITAGNLTGTVSNGQLANSSITVNAGTGLAGGGAAALGGSTTLNNAGVLSVTGNSDITATTVAGAVTLGDTATDADTPGTIVKRDGSGNFSAATISLDNNLNLPQTTATAGIIYSGSATFVHRYGNNNFFAGQGAGNLTMVGGHNTGLGYNALMNNVDGDGNTASGLNALLSNTEGDHNTAGGIDALASNTGFAGENTAFGAYALQNNISGNWNTAVGSQSLSFNTNGANNTAEGFEALQDNTSGNDNVAIGVTALQNNTTGVANTATGTSALYQNTIGEYNTADGVDALQNETIGGLNSAFGADAGYTITTGSGNIAIGVNAGDQIVTGNNNIDIGNSGFGDESGVIRIGTQGTHTKAVFLGIYGTTVGGSAPVVVNANGLLGTVSSSARFKQDIHSMDNKSDELLALKPVTFRYKPEYDPDGYPQFGLIAEDVEKVDPDLVLRDGNHEVYSVRYEAVNAMLLNEFLKEHKKVEEQKQKVEEQNQQIQNLQARLEKVEQLLNPKNSNPMKSGKRARP